MGVGISKLEGQMIWLNIFRVAYACSLGGLLVVIAIRSLGRRR